MSTREPVFREGQRVCLDVTQVAPMYGVLPLSPQPRWQVGEIGVWDNDDPIDVWVNGTRYIVPLAAVSPLDPNKGCPSD